MSEHDFDESILHRTSHRRWPLPDAPWVMKQTWHDLLFAHWPASADLLRKQIPGEFELDLFDHEAWLGLVAFRMTNVTPRGVPSLPWISAFPELNVRTYVRVGDRPGIFFFSLDAGSSLAVAAARALFNLPYYSAAMTVKTVGRAIEYRSTRASEPAAEFSATYEPRGRPFTAAEGTLEYFLTERYCLYHHDHSGAPYRLEIHHPPWRLEAADAAVERNTMAAAAGLVAGGAAVLHFSRRQDMVAWLPSRLDSA
jgi:uncharacterized protein YqjF (DUF2071 family)